MCAPKTEPTIEELIEASSLGTPEAKAARESADPEAVERVMERVRELSLSDEISKLFEKFRRDLGYTPPELYGERIDRLEESILARLK